MAEHMSLVSTEHMSEQIPKVLNIYLPYINSNTFVQG